MRKGSRLDEIGNIQICIIWYRVKLLYSGIVYKLKSETLRCGNLLNAFYINKSDTGSKSKLSIDQLVTSLDILGSQLYSNQT